MAFHFRYFEVEDEDSSLRVGTDAMLLGSWATPGKAKKILDIGTGCGVLALMMAQKSGATIDAIDTDLPSVMEARKNFSNAPWSSRITAIHHPLQSFSCGDATGYDFIISNPPYFSNSLKSPSARINKTRHDDSLSLLELAQKVSDLLSVDGRFSVILPSEPAQRFRLICEKFHVYLSRRMVIYPKPAAPSKRMLLEFSKSQVGLEDCQELIIRDSSGRYTDEYLVLTKDFHNF